MMNRSHIFHGWLQACYGIMAVGLVLVITTTLQAQGSHRALAPPDSPGGNLAANADLLRQLQQMVQRSDIPHGTDIDPGDLDPKLLEAVQHLAKQYGMEDQLPPGFKEWIEKAKAEQKMSVPGGSNNQAGQDPGFKFGPNGIIKPPNTNPGNRQPTPRQGRGQDSPKPTPGGQQPTPNNRPPGQGLIDDIPTPPRRPTPQGTPGETPSGSDLKLSQEDIPRDAARNVDLDQLRESGMNLREQFARVMEQARREAILHGDDSPQQQSKSGFAGMLEDALAKSSTELAEQLKSARLRPPKSRKDRRNNRQAAPSTPPNVNNKPNSMNRFNQRLESFSKQANQLSNNITKPQVTPATPSAPELDLSLPSGGSGQASLWLLAIVGGLAGVGYLVYRLALQTTEQRAAEAARRLPTELTTRDDVVRAFHALTHLTAAASNRWWTHRRAERALVESTPQARPALEALTHVYEEARYLPADEPLSTDQLTRAREALALLFTGKRHLPARGDQ